MPLTASMPTAIVPFKGYGTAVAHALDAVGAMDLISRQKTILVKPNLVNASPHPVTTPPECCEAVLRYIRCHSDADVVIAEGAVTHRSRRRTCSNGTDMTAWPGSGGFAFST